MLRLLSGIILYISLTPLILAQSLPTSTPKAPFKTTSKKVTDNKRSIVIPIDRISPVSTSRFDVAPTIDGKLDDKVWQSATVLKNFFQVQPGDNIEPSRPTEVMLGYDARHLYVAFRAYDDRNKIRSTIPKRDAIWDDDYVGMFLDTFNDKQRAYVLFFNPVGIQADGILTETGKEDYSIDIVMESKGAVSEGEFTVEIAIPFKSLRYEAGKGKIWRVHFYRRIKWANNELNSWMPISRDNSSELTQTGQITGLEGISTERTYELIPSVTISQTSQRVRAFPSPPSIAPPGSLMPDRLVNQPVNVDPGLTMKLNLTPAITLDAAVNPDFAQIEADQTVVTANQRFPIQFGEKRPFFFEGADIFRNLLRTVHTRSIIDPDYALKLTGRHGKNSFAMLLASDRAPGNYSEDERNDPDLRDTITKFADKNAFIGVLRAKRNFSTDSNIGLIATSYNFIENNNQLGSVDGRLRFNDKTTLSFQLVGTTSRKSFYNPDKDSNIFRTGNGLGYELLFEHFGRHLGLFLNAYGRTRDYRANVGFTPRTNTNVETLNWRYSSEPKPKATIISWRVGQLYSVNHDFQGRIQNWLNESFFRLQLKRQTNMSIGYRPAYERIFEEEFGAKRSIHQTGKFFGPDSERSARRQEVFGFAESNPFKRLSFNFFAARRWNELDYDFGSGKKFPRVSPVALLDPDSKMDPGPGNSLVIENSVRIKPTAPLTINFSYTKSRLVRNDTKLTAFDDNIYSSSTTWQFTRFLHTRIRMDYSSISSNVRSQFLFGWTPNPGTSFYAGYNDDFTRNGYSPLTDEYEPGFRRNRRTFFIKMSYLFRKSI